MAHDKRPTPAIDALPRANHCSTVDPPDLRTVITNTVESNIDANSSAPWFDPLAVDPLVEKNAMAASLKQAEWPKPAEIIPRSDRYTLCPSEGWTLYEAVKNTACARAWKAWELAIQPRGLLDPTFWDDVAAGECIAFDSSPGFGGRDALILHWQIQAPKPLRDLVTAGHLIAKGIPAGEHTPIVINADLFHTFQIDLSQNAVYDQSRHYDAVRIYPADNQTKSVTQSPSQSPSADRGLLHADNVVATAAATNYGYRARPTGEGSILQRYGYRQAESLEASQSPSQTLSAEAQLAERLLPAAASDAGRMSPTPKRRRGRDPKKRAACKAAMLDDLTAERIPARDLDAMPDKALVQRYGDPFGTKRTAVREARAQALSEFDAISRNSIRDK